MDLTASLGYLPGFELWIVQTVFRIPVSIASSKILETIWVFGGNICGLLKKNEVRFQGLLMEVEMKGM